MTKPAERGRAMFLKKNGPKIETAFVVRMPVCDIFLEIMPVKLSTVMVPEEGTKEHLAWVAQQPKDSLVFRILSPWVNDCIWYGVTERFDSNIALIISIPNAAPQYADLKVEMTSIGQDPGLLPIMNDGWEIGKAGRYPLEAYGFLTPVLDRIVELKKMGPAGLRDGVQWDGDCYIVPDSGFAEYNPSEEPPLAPPPRAA